MREEINGMNNGFNNYGQGGYMPNSGYQNGSYSVRPNYQQPGSMQQNQQMSYAPLRQQSSAPKFGDWVDGEEAARVYPFPPDWPVDTPLTLWDINQDVFYVRAKDSFGRPTPLKKARFTWEEPVLSLPGQSGAVPSMEGYATKDDLQAMKNEIIESLRSSQQAPSRSAQNQNGNRNGGRE